MQSMMFEHTTARQARHVVHRLREARSSGGRSRQLLHLTYAAYATADGKRQSVLWTSIGEIIARPSNLILLEGTSLTNVSVQT